LSLARFHLHEASFLYEDDVYFSRLVFLQMLKSIQVVFKQKNNEPSDAGELKETILKAKQFL